MLDQLSFLDNYDFYRSSNDLAQKYRRDPSEKVCRFCGKAYPETTFITIPHIVPELFGRNTVTSNEECDVCNQLFQPHETDTATMVQHYLTMLNIKTKKGVPGFQSRKKPREYATTFRIVDGQRKIHFDKNLYDFEIDELKKTFTVFFRTKNFRPYSVYRTFLKMAIAVLSANDLRMNPHYIQFLNSSEPIINGMQNYFAWRYVQKTKIYTQPSISLFKAKELVINENQYPEFVAILYFANVVWQMFLPISKKNIEKYTLGQGLTFLHYPSFMLENMAYLQHVGFKYQNNSLDIEHIELHHLDLSTTEKISITDKMVLHYQSKY